MSGIDEVLDIVISEWDSLCIRHYFIYKNDPDYKLYMASMGNGENSISAENYEYIVKGAQKLVSTDSHILDYKEADDRIDAVYSWENAVTEVTPVKNVVSQIATDEVSKLENDNYSKLDFHVTVVEKDMERVVFFKKVFPASIVKMKGAVLFQGSSFVRPKKDYFRIPKGFDFFVYKGVLYICNSDVFEKSFAITTYLMNSIKEHSKYLVEKGYLSKESENTVNDCCEESERIRKNYTRTIQSVKFKEEKYTKNQIMNEAKKNSNFKNKFKFSSKNGSIIVDNKEDLKVFIDFLNDDILTSGLGDTYKTKVKDRLP
ncbi:DUF4868 domain-containing protein [Enterococcus faecalis]